MKSIWRKNFQVKITATHPLVLTETLKLRGEEVTHSQSQLIRRLILRKRVEVTQPGKSEALKVLTLTNHSCITVKRKSKRYIKKINMR